MQSSCLFPTLNKPLKELSPRPIPQSNNKNGIVPSKTNATSVNAHPLPIAASIGSIAADAPAEKNERTILFAAVAAAGCDVCRSTNSVEVEINPPVWPMPMKKRSTSGAGSGSPYWRTQPKANTVTLPVMTSGMVIALRAFSTGTLFSSWEEDAS